MGFLSTFLVRKKEINRVDMTQVVDEQKIICNKYNIMPRIQADGQERYVTMSNGMAA